MHKLVAFVACSDDFENQPGVVNGCSDLLFEVLGCVEIKILRRVLLNRRVDLHAIDATPWLISTQVLGDRGVHARSAVGTNALPLGVPVEIEAVVEVEPGS